MSKGISKQQRKIIELVSIPGEPAGLPREVIQSQLWPEVFCADYRQTADSTRIVKEKKKCRVVLSRAIASLIRRGILEESPNHDHIKPLEIFRRGLRLPYQLQKFDGSPANGFALVKHLPTKNSGQCQVLERQWLSST